MYQQLTEGILFNAYIEIFIHKEDDRRIFAARKLLYSSETISTSINTRYREIKNIVFVRDVMPQKVTKFYKLNQDGIKESQLMQNIRIFRRHFQIVKFTVIKMFQFKEFDMLKKADLNIFFYKSPSMDTILHLSWKNPSPGSSESNLEESWLLASTSTDNYC